MHANVIHLVCEKKRLPLASASLSDFVLLMNAISRAVPEDFPGVERAKGF